MKNLSSLLASAPAGPLSFNRGAGGAC